MPVPIYVETAVTGRSWELDKYARGTIHSISDHVYRCMVAQLLVHVGDASSTIARASAVLSLARDVRTSGCDRCFAGVRCIVLPSALSSQDIRPILDVRTNASPLDAAHRIHREVQLHSKSCLAM